MRQGRFPAVLIAVAAALAILATPALAGNPPVHPMEGHWKGNNQYGAGVHLRVEGGFVRHAHGGGVSFSDARIEHNQIAVHHNGRLLYTATFRSSHSVTGTTYPPSGQPVRWGWHASDDRPL